MVLHAKLKKIKRVLPCWGKECYGNIFNQRATLEDIIRAKEAILEVDPSPENRVNLKRTEVELKRYLKIEEEYWRQKTEMK